MSSHPPLRKQVAGAVIGGSLALLLYAGYTAISPQIENLVGILITPQSRINSTAVEPIRMADKNVSDWEYKRMAAKAQRIANEFGAAPNIEPEVNPVILPDIAPEPEVIEAPEGTEGEDVAQDIVDAWTVLDEVPEDFEESFEFADDESTLYGETSDLPDSGVGVWLATLIAVVGTSFLIYRRKLAPCAQKSK